ncbi:hypothetical protein [Microcoleus sp. S28C3]|uniref:hypothetical protein n=1 Tax=Microcoleus sp. S28C3 TaxID=3055414 RepID=UPI00403F753F
MRSTPRTKGQNYDNLVRPEGTFECLELPGGNEPLLRVFFLEMLGIELSFKNPSLYLLPISPTETYLTIL